MAGNEKRKAAVLSRWRQQGFIVMPDGEQYILSFVALGEIVAGVQRYDARVDLANPQASWKVIFSESNDLLLTEEQEAYCRNANDNVLVVSLENPVHKREAFRSDGQGQAYSGLFNNQ